MVVHTYRQTVQYTNMEQIDRSLKLGGKITTTNLILFSFVIFFLLYLGGVDEMMVIDDDDGNQN